MDTDPGPCLRHWSPRSRSLGYTRCVDQAVATDDFTRSDVRRILGISGVTLRSWERAGLAEAKERYAFSDLVTFRTLQGLRQSKIPVRRIREALERLRLRLESVDRPLDELKIESDGRSIAVVLPGETLDAITGQLLFRFDVGDLRTITEMRTDTVDIGRTDFGTYAQECFDRALGLERNGAPDSEVISWYRRAMESDPTAVGALINLGAAQVRSGEPDSAARCFRSAVRLCPDNPIAHFNLAAVRESQGRTDEAVHHYAVALRCDPNYADAHFNLAQISQECGLLDEAARHWAAYVDLDPSSVWANIGRSKLESLQRAGHG